MLFRTRMWLAVVTIVTAVSAGTPAQTADPVSYQLSFADRVHRLMDVEVTFVQVPPGPLELRMSRSSPGRYALHEFAKNVFDVRASDAAGQALQIDRPDPYGWTVPAHQGTVRVAYRVFGDRVDGTYLGVDSTHAHINMPAALMWARGFESRPAVVQFEVPEGSRWRVATQLLPQGGDGLTFTAANLQYLMDSPAEVSDFSLRTFTAGGSGGPSIRIALHHDGTDAEFDVFARDVQRIVEEAHGVFGEFPAFEGGTYTFIADYLPWASGDGMEHRNSTILTSPSSLRTNRINLLGTVAHEFFHAWNVERIRPRSLEPFDFERANMSGELWFAEGFTSYYDPLLLRRAGLISTSEFASDMGAAINTVLVTPGRGVHSAVEMSRLAPFVDAATAIDRTVLDNTFISYYTWGAAIGLGLDLALRERTTNRVTLDAVMRALWQAHGRPVGPADGLVDRPYSMDDLQAAVASVSGDTAFAADFFRRYIEGREAIDYGRLLARAGIVLQQVAPGHAWAGTLRLQGATRGARITDAVPFGSPAYTAGLERDDVILTAAGSRISNAADWTGVLSRARVGDLLAVTFERRGQPVSAQVRLVEDPRVRAVPAEDVGEPVTEAQRLFRDAWLASLIPDP